MVDVLMLRLMWLDWHFLAKVRNYRATSNIRSVSTDILEFEQWVILTQLHNMTNWDGDIYAGQHNLHSLMSLIQSSVVDIQYDLKKENQEEELADCSNSCIMTNYNIKKQRRNKGYDKQDWRIRQQRIIYRHAFSVGQRKNSAAKSEHTRRGGCCRRATSWVQGQSWWRHGSESEKGEQKTSRVVSLYSLRFFLLCILDLY